MTLAEALSDGSTCKIFCGGEEYSGAESGIAPLLNAIKGPYRLEGGIAYDIIVGKAAALLYAHMRVCEVHTNILSKSGKEILERYGIRYSYNELTEMIINRRGDGMCPMEIAVKNTEAPDEAFHILCDQFSALKKMGV